MNSNQQTHDEEEQEEFTVMKPKLVSYPSSDSDGSEDEGEDGVDWQNWFMMYVKNNQPEMLDEYLKSTPETNVDINGYLNPETLLTPLMFCCIKDYESLVQVLCSDRRLDPNKRDIEGFTALHFALDEGNPEIVSLIISLPNIQLDVKDRADRSLAEVAVQSDLARKDFTCTEVLSEVPGIDWSFTDCLGRTLLMIACREHPGVYIMFWGK